MKKAVLISCFDWYEKRLEPIKNELEQDGFLVTILTSDFDHIGKCRIENKNVNCTYISVKEYKKNVSIARILSHSAFSKEVYKQLKNIQPNLIYALVPPNTVANVCAKYKKQYNDTKLVFDLIDMWPESMPGKKFHGTPPFLYWKNLRDSSFLCADHIFTECSLYQEKLNEVVKSKCSTLYLFKETNSNFEIKSSDSHQTLKLCYLGSMNYIIDIEKIAHIVELLSNEYNVEVKVIGKGENKESFINALKNSGATVDDYGPIFDEKKKFELLHDCDYGFNMMVESVNVGLTIKSIDYLSYGIPLINNIKGDTWQIVSKYGVGINYTDDESFLLEIKKNTVKSHRQVYDVFQSLFSKEAFIHLFKEGLNHLCE